MRTITTTMTNHARILGLALLAAAALSVGLAALPSSSDSNAISRVAPQSAEAFEGGIDGGHAWIKVTAGEVAGGAVEGICRLYAHGPAATLCPRAAQVARDLIGNNRGVWVEIYPTHVNAGTW
ncbi:MAG: hypothetical protein ACRDLN_08825 [Solirubrobacteraceae bacterium]